MTSPPSYATMSWSGIALLRCRGWCKVVRVEGEEEHGESGCWRWNSSTTAGAWTSKWGSHMLSECDQPMNLTRYHNLPHLNLESRTSSTSYSSWSLTMTGPGCGHCKHLNSELGAQTALHLSVSKGVIQRKRESWSSATSSSNDNSRPGPMAQVVHTGMKYILFT